MQGALKKLRGLRAPRLPLPTREQVTRAFALLFRMLLWLPMRTVCVFFGTYKSGNPDVHRAGLVADLNAFALASAVILLVTSRATFQKAEDGVKHYAWANLLQDTPGVACASLNQQPFSGYISQRMHFHCNYTAGGEGRRRMGWPVDASNKDQVLTILHALDECKAFSMGMHFVYNDSRVCYAPADARQSIYKGCIDSAEPSSLEFDQGLDSWASLDLITPKKLSTQVSAAGKSCTEGLAAGALASALNKSKCYSPSGSIRRGEFPNDLGFPQGMEILRWLDRFGKGIYLGVNCTTTLRTPSPGLQNCINSSPQLAQAKGLWSKEFTRDFSEPSNKSSFQLKGREQGAFCPASGVLDMTFSFPSSYRCSNGAQSTNLSILNNEIAAVEGIRYFAYFRCLSFDELFGVYVGTVGVLMGVALASIVVYVTKVARPMCLADRRDWSLDAVQQNAGVTHPMADEGRHVREKKLVDVILRCAAACAVGAMLGMVLYVPWQGFRDHDRHAHVCNPP